jgi:hypothetical protein
MKKALLALALLALSIGPPPPKIVKCSMTADGLVDIYLRDGKLQFFYPRVIVFDEDGALVYTAEGYGPQTAANIVKGMHALPRKNAPRIDGFAAWLRDDSGKPVDPASLKGKPTVAQFGAAWCKPCHALEAELRHVGGINLLLIDADSKGRQDELRAALQRRMAKK